jgi:hypothetical protein
MRVLLFSHARLRAHWAPGIPCASDLFLSDKDALILSSQRLSLEPFGLVEVRRRLMEPAMNWNWRELVGLSLFLALFCAALVANVTDGSPSRGAWVTQAMR